MTSIPDLSQLEDNPKPLIARPDLRPGVLLPPVVPPPPSTQGISSNQTMPDPPAASVAPPTVSPAQGKVDFLRESPSGIGQLHPKSTIGKIGKGILQGADILGSTFAPGIAANIPGTTMHHNLLEAQAEKRLGSDVANQEKQATTREANAKADAENAPMPEKWDLVPGWQGPNGEPMEREETSGQFRVAEGVPGAKPIQKEAAMKPPHVAYDNGIPVSVTGQDGRVFDVNDPNLPPELKPLVEAANRAHQQRLTEQNTAEDKRTKSAQDSQNRVFAHQEQLERDRENHAQQKQSQQNAQITPAAQGIMQQTEPVKAQVEQLLQALAPYNNPKAGRLTMDRLKYALGEPSRPGELADQISKLELNRIISGARILKGSSRAYQALERAMVHAPNPWVDKPQLMYQKLQTILQNLNDVEKDAIAYGKKGQTVQEAQQVAGGGGQPLPEPELPRPAGVPDSYIYRANGPKGAGWYKP